MNETKTFTRFNLAQRIEHVILILSFSLLCLTGLPQEFCRAGLGGNPDRPAGRD